jgi:hypothetical protein
MMMLFYIPGFIWRKLNKNSGIDTKVITSLMSGMDPLGSKKGKDTSNSEKGKDASNSEKGKDASDSEKGKDASGSEKGKDASDSKEQKDVIASLAKHIDQALTYHRNYHHGFM